MKSHIADEVKPSHMQFRLFHAARKVLGLSSICCLGCSISLQAIHCFGRITHADQQSHLQLGPRSILAHCGPAQMSLGQREFWNKSELSSIHIRRRLVSYVFLFLFTFDFFLFLSFSFFSFFSTVFC